MMRKERDEMENQESRQPLDGAARTAVRLARMERLEKGWYNGEGQPIPKRSIETATKMLNDMPDLAKVVNIYPNVEGHIEMEFKVGDWDYSIEFYKDGCIGLWGVDLASDDEMREEIYGGLTDALYFDVWKILYRFTPNC